MSAGARGWLAAPAMAVLGAGLLIGGCAQGPLNSASDGVGCSVTVQIPSSSQGALGTVQATFGGHQQQLTRNTSTIPVGCGQQVRLTAAATYPDSNPFVGWQVGGQSQTGTSVTVVADGIISATPQFFVPVRPSPTPTPKATPTPTAAPTTVTLDQWLSYDSATKTATLKLIAGYQGVNHGLSYDGLSDGKLDVTVPVGWNVVVDFSNAATINHSAVVVTASGTSPVFPGAGSPQPTVGLAPGGSVSFSFVDATAGSYRIACLVPGHEGLGMWATFGVTAAGLPTIHL